MNLRTRVLGLGLLTALLFSACAEDIAAPTGDKSETAEPAELSVVVLGAADTANSVYQGDVALNELTIASLTRRFPYHVWTFELTEASNVFVDLANRDGEDPYLYLYELRDGAWAYFATNDDCDRGDTLNSCWEGELGPNRYALIATSWHFANGYGRKGFEYHLTVFAEPTVQLCGSRGLSPCAEGYYCDWDSESNASNACGANDAGGVCRHLPDVCPQHLLFVCGCNGQTYSNVCYAHRNGVDVSFVGECPRDGQGSGETCGGIGALQCGDGLVCDYSGVNGCDIADVAGTCTPEEHDVRCTEEYSPRCGCDGVTYENECYRRAAMVALDHDGACENPGNGEGEMCGGIAGFMCADGLRCDYSALASCEIRDGAGVCVVDEPVICTADYRPVCSCSGRTYSNDCRRIGAGEPLAHLGACE